MSPSSARRAKSDILKDRFAYMRKNYPGFHEETVATHVNFIRTFDLLWRAVSKRLRPHGLTPPAMGVLFLLDSQKEAIPMSRIGAQMVVSQANITGLLDTLAKAGLARRLADPKDRRVIRAELTPEGRRKVRSFWPHIISLLRQIYSGLSSGEHKAMLRMMEKIRRKTLPLLAPAIFFLVPVARAQEQAPPAVLTLRQAVETAITRSPALGGARAALNGALSRQLALLGKYDPSVFAAIRRLDQKTPPAVFFQTPRTITDSADVSLSKRFPTATTLTASSAYGKEIDDVSSAFTLNPRVRSRLDLSLKQPLLKGFLGRPERAALRESEFDVKAAREEFKHAALKHARAVAASYWELWLSRRSKDVLLDSQEEAREFLETTKRLFKRFEAEKDDLLRAEASLLAKELDVLEAQSLIVEREEELKEVLAVGTLPGALEEPPPPPAALPAAEDAVLLALSRRADLAASEHAVARDRLRLNSLDGLGLPSVDLAGGLGWSGLKSDADESLRQLNRAGFRTWSVGLTLSYAFGAREDGAAELAAESAATLSLERSRGLRLAIEREVRNAISRLVLAGRRVEIAAQLEKKQTEAFEIARQKYRQARISSQDRLIAANTALGARASRLRSQADGAVSLAFQKAATGELLDWLGVAVFPAQRER